MIIVDEIRALVEEKIADTELFITDVKVLPVNRIQVSIDKKTGGVIISDCTMLHRFIESKLDRNKEDYQLDVSSAGMEEPFKVRQQYYKNIGRKVEVITNDGIRIDGILAAADDNGIRIEIKVNDKQKKGIAVIKYIGFEQIKQTKKIVTFK